MAFRKIYVALAACFVAALASLALAQTPRPLAPNPVIPLDAKMQINLYPITRFRGSATVVTSSQEQVGPIAAESIFVTRGVWDLCSEKFYYGQCVRVSSTMPEIPVAIVVRSIKLVGDTGPSFVNAPTARAGADIPSEREDRVVANPVLPSPVVAPKVEEGGRRGENPQLAGAPAQSGRETKFYAAPAQNGLRVLACAQQPGGSPGLRCVQSAADGFCAAEGFKDSAFREFEVVADKAYLSNVLCQRGGEPAAAAEKGGGFRLPFLK